MTFTLIGALISGVMLRKGPSRGFHLSFVSGENGRSLFCVREFVTDAPDGEHQLWIFRVILDLGSQSIDVRIYRSIVAFVGIVPDFFEQVLAREYASWIRSEQAQEVEFFRSKIDVTVGDCYFAPNWVDAQMTSHDRSFI